jgi:predicted ATPase
MAVRFTRVVLENWRNFRKVDVGLSERTFIVGPNAAGKTNLIDAFRLVRDVAQAEGSLVRAVSVRGGIAHLRSLHARQASDVRLRLRLLVESNEWTYDLTLSGTKAKALRIVREIVEKNEARILSRPNAQDRADPRLLEQTHLEQLSQNVDFRELADALASVIDVHVVPQVAKSSIRSDGIARRDAPGSDFIDQIARLPAKRQRGDLGRIQRLLKIAVPQFSELQVVRDQLGRPHLEAKYKHWRPKGSWQRESDFSDGTLRLIGLLWALMQDDAPLLLEEAELSLHRDVVRQLPRLVAAAAAQRGRQVLVSTHAEEVLNDRGVDPEEILLLVPTPEETQVVQASQEQSLISAARSGVPLGKLVTARTRPKGIEQLTF